MNKIMSSKLRILTECSFMIILSFVLSNIIIFKMPFGGSITLCSMCPIIMASLRNGTKYGLLTGFTYSLIQIIMSFHIPPIKSIFAFFIVIFLDYIIPYTSLGLANLFYDKINSNKVFFASICASLIRYFSSILSGIIVWKELCPPNISIWKYSVIYNSAYMIPEIIITSLVCSVLYKYISNCS